MSMTRQDNTRKVLGGRLRPILKKKNKKKKIKKKGRLLNLPFASSKYKVFPLHTPQYQF